MWWRLACGAGLSIFAACSDGARSGGEPDSVTSTISKEGGTISVDGASLTIPKGALAAPTPISIDKTDVAAPRGYVGYSSIYNFRPGGLVFAEPAKVTIQFAGDGRRAGIYWTTAGVFERLGGAVKGDRITASVTHFSSGFVGTGSAPEIGTSMPDASTMPEPPIDSGSVGMPATDSGSPIGASAPEGGA